MLAFLYRCGVAAACGALVGLERELKQKPAGFRTNILICAGSAMYSLPAPVSLSWRLFRR